MLEEQDKRTDVQLQESLERLAVIYEVHRGIARELDMDILVKETLSLLGKYLKADGMAVFFVDKDKQELVLHSALGLSQELIAILARRKIGEGVIGRTVLTGRPHFFRLAGIPQSNARKVALQHGLTNFGSYPLIVSSKPVGTIAIANKNDRPILKEDQELLMAICSQLGTLLQNVQLSTAMNNQLAERKRVENALQQSEERYRLLAQNLAATRKPVHYADNTYGVFSEKTRQVIEQAQKYATDRSMGLLICGETGTGKEKIARITHGSDSSIQDQRPFVAINCAAITTSLFESELFGYETGAFTGGLKQGQIGKIQLAAGGTLFLDEIGEMPLATQAKLLRVIQEKEFYRVGGLKKVKMDVRIICATNSNLLHAIAEGRFRKDLYYRLKVGYLHLLPLRERVEEVMPLAIMFLQYFAQQSGKICNVFGESAINMLISYDWPGNIRELRNVMEWTAFMYDGITLQSEHLDIIRAGDPFQTPGDCQTPQRPAAIPNGNLKKCTDQLVKQTLESHGGNKAAAARELGISRRALYRILEKTDKKSVEH